MALIDGDDFVNGSLFSYQQGNRLKNHWRGAAAPSNIQPGMLFSDSDNDKLFHAGAGTGSPLDEVLQETRSGSASPIFDNLYLDLDEAAVTDPPTEAELQTVFGATPAVGLIGWLKNTTSGSNKVYQVFSDGTSYFYLEFTKAT